MMYPGYIPNMRPRLLHYGLKFSVGDWHFDKAEWRDQDMTNNCWQSFPQPPELSSLPDYLTPGEVARDNISIECVKTLNEALYLHHVKRGCLPPLKHEAVEIARADEIIKMKVDDQHLEWDATLKDVKPSRLKYVKSIIEDKSKALKSIPTLISPKYWMVGLWTVLVSLFLLLVSSLFSRNRASLQKARRGRLRRTSGVPVQTTSSGEVTTLTVGESNV